MAKIERFKFRDLAFGGTKKARNTLAMTLFMFLIVLLIPLGVLFHQTKVQIKQAIFLEYSSEAQDIVARIEEKIFSYLESEEERPFDDYGFLNVSENSLWVGKGVAFSPLSRIPPQSKVPGVIGYFQVNPDGSFQTPFLPELQPKEYAEYVYAFGQEELDRREKLKKELQQMLLDNRLISTTGNIPEENNGRDGFGELSAQAATAQKETAPLTFDETYLKEQQQLENPTASAYQTKQQAYLTKRETLEQSKIARKGVFNLLKNRAPEQQADIFVKAFPPNTSQGPDNVEIETFEGEIDPLHVVVLEGGQFIFYRKVWRGKQRFIQGFAVQREAFLRAVAESPFQESDLGRTGRLHVSFRGQVIRTFEPRLDIRQLEKPIVLFRTVLTSPLKDFELILTINQLPQSEQERMFYILSCLVGIVLSGGMLGIYRLGITQIELVEKKSDFVSAVSHELKTPLTSIRMYSEMLRSGWVPNEEKKKSYYDFIFFESERLSRLIANVLQFAQLSKNEDPLDLKRIHVLEVLELVRSKVMSQIEGSGYTLEINASSESGVLPARAEELFVLVDEDGLSRIFINLIDNAIKFSGATETKRIELGLRIERGAIPQAVFSVRDYGPGIEVTERKRIFDPFYRSENELTRTTKGTGIGLSLVAELCRKMQGTVRVENRSPGAEFEVRLPLR